MKQIRQKYWSFKEMSPPIRKERKHKFLWWEWTEVEKIENYKFASESDLLAEVNNFIAANNVNEIISLKNTSGSQRYWDGFDGPIWCERFGGIELTYIENVEK